MGQLKFITDSRQKTDKGVFFAIKGAKTDGHLYLEEAKKNGAESAVVSKVYKGEDFGLKLIRSENPVQTLQQMAQTKIETAHPFVVAVTGSFGKTTTKEALFQAFSSKKSCFKNPQNQNSQIGMPLSILNFYNKEPLVFLEMGIENEKDMENLVRIAKPDIAVITRIAEAHLESLKSLENIALEKGKIVVQDKTRHLFLHHSAKYFYDKKEMRGVEKTLYGHFDEPLFGDIYDLIEKLGPLLGLTTEPFSLKLPDLRYQKKSYQNGMVVLDCYNANPTTMRTFFNLAPIEKGKRRVAIIGQMASLGEQSDYFHLKLIEDLRDCFDLAFCLGLKMKPVFEYWKKEGKAVFWVEAVEDLQSLIKKQIQPQDAVLVKGSNANRLWEVEPWLEHALSN
ncbi:MAG: UDP-N-acetylmuramoyl-tripeptide--D-alanyl-D-alanine ligase [Chlamydiae bacterium]|nr:UDP-N-acetylmuramoyl-tripeptide--D-alanyl-D-alanine ligase [Chlamydiota bacterium]